MFKYSAFTENTPEMREYLEKIGYNESFSSDFDKGDYIKTQTNGIFYTFQGTKELIHLLWSDKIIDCTGNPELFKAVVAINDENDYMQWIIIDTEVYLNLPKGTFILNNGEYYKVGNNIDSMYCHKATIEELKEHFKIEK